MTGARSWRKRSDSSTANSVEIAITSAPSVADIGLSGTRVANRTSADQPVASAIGIERHERPLGTAEDREQHEPDRGEAGEQRQQSPPWRAQLGVRLGGDDGRARPAARVTRPAGSARAHRVDHVLLVLQVHQADPERERRGVASGVRTACEKYGGTEASSVSIALCERASRALQQVGQREGRAERGGAAARSASS